MKLAVTLTALLASIWRAECAEQTCYPVVGCFSNDPPWTSASRSAPPPEDPASVNTSMILFTPSITAGVVIPTLPEINLTGVTIDKDVPTYVIIHGYGANYSSPWVVSVKDSLLRRTGGNVLVLAWYTKQSDYEQAASNARVAGTLSAMLLKEMQIDPSNMHFIAHCVGSHIASYTAKQLNQSGKKVRRLTSLNPAAPLFEDQPAEVRLDMDDADFVDVLHTEINYTGMAKPAGHVDFYFNSGTRQPGCEVPTDPKTATCSHSIAEKYYAETMEEDCMMGQPAEVVMNKDGGVDSVRLKGNSRNNADDLVPVGLTTPQTSRGVYVVHTNPQMPYCQTKSS